MIECVYQNDTSRMVIVKCIGADHFYREKVVMPQRSFGSKHLKMHAWKSGKCQLQDRCSMFVPM